MRWCSVLALVAVALVTTRVVAQGKPVEVGAAVPDMASIVYAGATLHTGTGEVLSDASVVVAHGVIQQIGRSIQVPAGARTLDVKGRVITPGLVDALTSIGLIEVELEEQARDDRLLGGNLLQAGFRAADGYNPASAVIGVTRAEGLTSAGVIPTGGLISGQSAWADLNGATATEALAAAPLALHVRVGAAVGGGHAGALLRVREAFDDARFFQKNRAAFDRHQARPLAASRLDLEALARALDGKLPVVFHVDRAAEIMSVLNLGREYTLRSVIAGGAEAWKVARQLAAAQIPVFVDPFARPSSFDALGAREDNATLLHAAGVTVALSTEDTHHARKLRQAAGNAVRAGLPYNVALAAITRVPAEALGMGARYGTLAPGKVANLAVWSGDPLELSTRLVDLMIRGQRVSLRNRQTALLEKYRTLER